MSYSRDNFSKVKREYEEKLYAKTEAAKARLREVHEALPAVADIDRELANTGLLIMQEISKGKEGLDERLETIRLDNEALRAERDAILTRNGYPVDYTEIKYDCKKCHDSGFDGMNICSCMRFALSMAAMESSGLGRLFESQSFDTFSLKYYSSDRRTLEQMTKVLEICTDFAEGFDSKTHENLFLCGKTGLGKTHMSTAIAAAVIGRGYEVVYESTQNLFDDYSVERFGRVVSGRSGDTARYLDADLLIIDDLGTETSNSFTQSCLYSLINSRVVSGKPMIINTNLSSDEIKSRYGDRIFSRLFGEFTVLPFCGTDVRLQKLRQG